MSTSASTADLWIANLEDILGLPPAERHEAVAEHARARTGRFARAGLVLGLIAVVGLSAVAVDVARRGLTPNVGERTVEIDRSPASSSRPEKRLPGAQGVKTAESVDIILDPIPSTTVATRSPDIAEQGSKTVVVGQAPSARRGQGYVPPRSIGIGGSLARSETNRITRIERDASPDLTGRNPAPAADRLGLAADLAKASSVPSVRVTPNDPAIEGAARPSPSLADTRQGVADQPDNGVASTIGARATEIAREKKPANGMGAIDALRMLRRQ